MTVNDAVHTHRCCLDGQPHMLTVQDCNMLCNFAELVVREVEKKHVVRTCSPSTMTATYPLSSLLQLFRDSCLTDDHAGQKHCQHACLLSELDVQCHIGCVNPAHPSFFALL